MSTTIESLELELQASSQSAESGLDALSASLEKLKKATSGGVGLTAVTKQIKALDDAAKGVDSASISNLDGLTKAIQTLSNLGGLKLSSTIATQITAISNSAKGLGGVDFAPISALASALQPLSMVGKVSLTSAINQLQRIPELAAQFVATDMNGFKTKIQELVSALSPLSTMPKQTISSTLNQIKKIPDIFAGLQAVDMGAFTAKINELATALRPLADEMNKVATGFSAFPAKIQKLLSSTNRLSNANNKASLSYVNLYAKLKIAYTAVRNIGSKIVSAIIKMNDYIENINLFNVSMGEFASEAQKYAESIGDVMGIDPGEWMRNQGIFMTLATGFGVVSDRAYTMSTQLTQLGYDLSSFFNISFEDSMQKLQSGLSGELEPLRRLGFDLSQARLKAIALSLGIDKTFNSMTQAEKAQLRYYAIMTQVTTAQGDMARTLEAPANQLRIFKSQLMQLIRAIGSVFIPILNKVLPYLTAGAKVLRYIVEAVAKLSGFTMPEIDYSGIDVVAGGAEDAEDALDGASESAKELKRSLLGIDEINALSDNSKSADSVLSDLSEFDFELPTYDFLENMSESKINEIVEKMKEWLGITGEINSWSDLMNTKFGDILELVMDIGLTIAGYKIASSVIEFFTGSKFMTGVKTLFTNFSTGFSTAKSDGKGFTDSTIGGLNNVRESMGKVTSALIGTLGVVAGFALAKKGAYDLVEALSTEKKEGLGGAIFGLVTGGVTAVAGGFLVGGPVGALVGGLIALAGSLVGTIEKEDELRAKLVADSFITDHGLKLGDLAEKYKSVWGESETLAIRTTTAKDTIEDCSIKIGLARQNIQPYLDKVIETGTLTQQETENMSGYVTTMVDNIKEQMNTRVGTILDTFNTFITAAKDNFGINLDLMTSDLLEFKAISGGITEAYQSKITSILVEATKKDGKGNPIGLSTEKRQELQNNVNALSSLTIAVSDEQAGFNSFVEQASKGLSITSVDAAEAKINELAEIAGVYKESLTTARNNTLAQIETLILQNKALYDAGNISAADYNRFNASFTNAKSNLETAYKGALSKLVKDTETVATAIQVGALNNIKSLIIKQAQEQAGASESDRNNFFSKYSDARQSSELFITLETAEENIYSLISPVIDEMLKNVGSSKTSINMSEIVQSIMNILSTKYRDSDSGFRLTSFYDEVALYLNRLFHEMGIPGYANGGFPEQGEMFIAREAGAEMVGAIGHKTSVANNEQIIEGIKRGVIEANQESGAYGGGNWTIQIVDSEGNIKSETIISAAERKNRRDGRTIIPMGV